MLAALLFLPLVSGCTNILLSSSAASDGHNSIAYNADSASLFGSLYHYQSTVNNPPGSSRQIHDWDTGVYLGSIPEAPSTYNVVGNANEKGLAIGETTFGGLEELCDTFPGSVMDYGSLIYVTLQRAATAREAILTMDMLMQDHGYASEGESFSIVDSDEVWLMEVIGKGKGEKGSVWVAKKVPDGAVCSHANQARITTFDRDSPEDTLYAKDVVDFARKMGLYEGADEDFSFSDTYDPVKFEGARFCEARVWSFYSSIMGPAFEKQYEDYAWGKNLTNRMPLFVYPSSKLSLSDVAEAMRSHFEGMSLDFSEDVGAGGFGAPYRWRPLTWKEPNAKNKNEPTYVNERAIGTQQTGWNFIAQVRKDVPEFMKAVIWFGVDDSATTVRVPVYASSSKLPLSFAGKGPQDGIVPPMMEFSTDSAFYVFNLVANWAYSRWADIYPVVLERIKMYEEEFTKKLASVDAEAIALWNNGQWKEAKDVTENWGVAAGDELTKEWFKFFGELFVRFRDGYDIQQDLSDPECGCDVGGKGYNDETYERIVEETGDRYLIPEDKAVEEAAIGEPKIKTKKTKSKLELRAML